MKISLYTLMLPLLAGLAAFSSKERSPDYELTWICSCGLFFVSAVLFVRNARYKLLCLIGVLALTAYRVSALLIELPGSLNLLHQAGSFIVIACAALATFLKVPKLMLRQMYGLAGISIVISLLQMNGTIWAQQFGSAVVDKGVTTEVVAFQDYESVQFAGLLQTRPDGFTHANNLTSQLLLLFYTFVFFFYTVNNRVVRASTWGLLTIALAIALNGGKVILLGLFLVYGASLLATPVRKTRALQALAVTIGAYVIYYIIFPGLFIVNFNPDLFVHNASDRIANVGAMANTDKLIPIANFVAGLGSGRYITEAYIVAQNFKVENSTEGYSGIARLAPYSTEALAAILVFGIAWKRRLGKLRPFYIRHLACASLLMLAGLGASLFGGPFYRTVWFCFFSALVLAPFLVALFDKKFLRSVRAVSTFNPSGVDLASRRGS